MIPKKIHYCWFGGNLKPEIIEKCISSWRKFCPDWDIVEWNESNYDVTVHPYTREAYEEKKWAFVSDVARLEIVLREGGIYMDTDVELLTSLDNITDCDAFYAFETNLNVASGLGFGAIAGHPSLSAMLSHYDSKHFIVNGKPDLSPCPAKNTEALRNQYPQFQRNGSPQIFENVRILSGTEYAAIAYHHGAKSWVDGASSTPHAFKDTRFKRWMRKPERYDKIERKLGKKALAIYTFISYDLLEMGPVYYIKRVFRKRK